MNDETREQIKKDISDFLIHGLSGGMMCVGKEILKPNHRNPYYYTKIFRVYYKWPCDNPKLVNENEVKG